MVRKKYVVTPGFKKTHKNYVVTLGFKKHNNYVVTLGFKKHNNYILHIYILLNYIWEKYLFLFFHAGACKECELYRYSRGEIVYKITSTSDSQL